MIGHRSHAIAPNEPGEPVAAARKEELRRRARQVRDAVPAERRAQAAASATTHLLALPGLVTVQRVALFAAVGSELDPAAAVARLRARGVEIVYPRVVRGARRLEFHLVTGEGELAPGAFGIPEPAPDAPVAPVQSIDAFVVPGLAFDAAGARVGWGRGYYDRSLAAAPDRLRIGYCFDCQLVAEVPSEPSDLPMHVLVTESGVLVPA
jgi:5-formyltetrahydrofolate cyclo-ligase